MCGLSREKIERVVVRGAYWVGDAVMTIPALRELRRVLPEAQLTLATRAGAAPVLAEGAIVDDILVSDTKGPEWKRPFIQAQEWRRRRFDLAILFQNAFAPALISFMARVPQRLGYATQGRGLLLTYPQPSPLWRNERHESFYYLNLIAGLERLLDGSSKILDRDPVFGLNVGDERKRAAQALLRARGLREGQLLIALCPGSINSRAKRWPAERFAALADKLITHLRAGVVLIGSPAELAVSEEVTRQMRQTPITLTGETDLAEAVAVLSIADLLVTNDTGPAHIAAALDRPTIVIFGPTNPLTTRPYSKSAEIIRQPPDCAPCMLRDCPIDDRCMTAISPDAVFDRAVEVLEKSKAGVLPLVEIT